MGGFRSGHPFPALNTKSALTVLVDVFILGFDKVSLLEFIVLL